ncbi:MAG: TetR/AcrR family transcriptional regulator [Chloroflexota bacterium]
MHDTTETSGLRERKKAETRAALSAAALNLAVERGVDAITADEIAAAANVSVRTFHNYFASKEEALLAPFRAVLRDAADRLLARPADEPILDALEGVWVDLASREAVPAETKAQVDRLWTSPHMAAYQHRLIEEAVRLFIPVVAARTGTDPVHDLYPNLVTAASVAAIFTALEHRPGRELTHEERVPLVHEGFDLLRSGLRRPGTTVT